MAILAAMAVALLWAMAGGPGVAMAQESQAAPAPAGTAAVATAGVGNAGAGGAAKKAVPALPDGVKYSVDPATGAIVMEENGRQIVVPAMPAKAAAPSAPPPPSSKAKPPSAPRSTRQVSMLGDEFDDLAEMGKSGAGRQGKAAALSSKEAAEAAELELRKKRAEEKLKIIYPPADGRSEVKRLGALWSEAWAKGDGEAADARRAEILELKATLGIDDLFVFARLVLNLADVQMAKDPASAASLAEFAALLAPDMSAPLWKRLEAEARLAWKAKRFPVVKLWSCLKGAVSHSASLPMEKGARALDLVVVVPIALLLAFGIFVLVCLCRKMRYVLHDLSHLTPSGVGPVLRFALLVVVTSLLAQAGFGAFAPLAFIGLLILPYLSLKERVAMAVATLAVGSMPLVASKVAANDPFLAPDAQFLYLMDKDGVGNPYSLAKEAQLSSAADSSYAISYVLGRKALRFGEYDRAKPLLRQAGRLGQDAPEPWVAQGNVALLQGDMQAAYENYTRARQHSTAIPEAAYDLSSYYMHMVAMATAGKSQETPAQVNKMKGQAKSFYDEAILLRPSLAGIPNDMRANNFVLTPRIDTRDLTARTVQTELAEKLGARVTNLLFGGHSPDWSLKATLTMLAVWMLYVVFRRMVPVSRPCFKCGAPTCGRCDELKCPSPGLCPECFEAFGQKVHPDAMASARREMQIRSSRRRRKAAVLLSALVLPGTGDLWRGKAIRGLLVVVLSLLLGALVAMPNGVFPLPFDGIPALAKRGPAAVALGVLWLSGVIATWRGLKRDSLGTSGESGLAGRRAS